MGVCLPEKIFEKWCNFVWCIFHKSLIYDDAKMQNFAHFVSNTQFNSNTI